VTAHKQRLNALTCRRKPPPTKPLHLTVSRCLRAWCAFHKHAHSSCQTIRVHRPLVTTVSLALAVLAALGPPQLTILGHLERNDK
jgi:fumarate reductase subunit D